jgi:hypothetical protein
LSPDNVTHMFKPTDKQFFIPLIGILMFFSGLVMTGQNQHVSAQNPLPGKSAAKLEIYYFHPTERCPIDQSIEETTRKMMQNDFAKEIKEGTIRFQVLNTDDRANDKIAGQFEINSQALYLVTFIKGKEIKNDLTEFAFSNCLSNPAKFKSGLKQEILQALK